MQYKHELCISTKGNAVTPSNMQNNETCKMHESEVEKQINRGHNPHWHIITIYSLETVLGDLIPHLRQRHELHVATDEAINIKQPYAQLPATRIRELTIVGLKGEGESGQICIAATNSPMSRNPYCLELAISQILNRLAKDWLDQIHQR